MVILSVYISAYIITWRIYLKAMLNFLFTNDFYAPIQISKKLELLQNHRAVAAVSKIHYLTPFFLSGIIRRSTLNRYSALRGLFTICMTIIHC